MRLPTFFSYLTIEKSLSTVEVPGYAVARPPQKLLQKAKPIFSQLPTFLKGCIGTTRIQQSLQRTLAMIRGLHLLELLHYDVDFGNRAGCPQARILDI